MAALGLKLRNGTWEKHWLYHDAEVVDNDTTVPFICVLVDFRHEDKFWRCKKCLGYVAQA